MKMKLTKSAVESIEPPQAGHKVIWDDKLTGFAVRVSSKGSRSYFYQYRTKSGRQGMPTIGRHGKITPDQARRIAKGMSAVVADGNDPAQEIRENKQAERDRLAAPRVEEMVAAYVDLCRNKSRRPSTIKEYERLLEAEIAPAIGRRRIQDMTTQDLEEFHHRFADRPYIGNRILAVLSAAWNRIAIKQGWCDRNPAKGIEKHKEMKRIRYLEPEERARLINALNDTKGPAADAVRLAMLTGARIGECLQARVEDFELNKKRWSKPASTTKTDQPHVTFLSAPALKLVSELIERAKGPLLFPGVGRQPQRYYRNTWGRIIEKANLPGLRVHDLRHSFASAAISEGYSLALVGELLGHASVQTTARYSHLLEDPAREAMERIGGIIAGDGPQDGDNEGAEVVELKKKGT